MKNKKYHSTLFSFIGVMGVIATTALAISETPKAMQIVEDMEEKNKIEILKRTWKCYLPTILSGTATIICILSADNSNKKQKMALINAYTILNNSYKEYYNKTKAILGDDEIEIRKAIAEDQYDKNSVLNKKNLFYDEYSKTYFNKTMDEIILAEYELNRIFAINGWASVTDWYDLLGIKYEKNDDILFGWSEDAAENFSYKWIEFEHDEVQLNDGMKCCIIHILYPPTTDFMNYY